MPWYQGVYSMNDLIVNVAIIWYIVGFVSGIATTWLFYNIIKNKKKYEKFNILPTETTLGTKSKPAISKPPSTK